MCFHVFDFTILFFYTTDKFFFSFHPFCRNWWKIKKAKDVYKCMGNWWESSVCALNHTNDTVRVQKAKKSFMYIYIYSVEEEERHFFIHLLQKIFSSFSLALNDFTFSIYLLFCAYFWWIKCLLLSICLDLRFLALHDEFYS